MPFQQKKGSTPDLLCFFLKCIFFSQKKTLKTQTKKIALYLRIFFAQKKKKETLVFKKKNKTRGGDDGGL